MNSDLTIKNIALVYTAIYRFLILAIQFIVGKRKVIEGKRTLSDLFMVLFLLVIGISVVYGILADTVLQDYETETSIDGQVYDNPFNEFTITRGKTYEITYLARTRIIIDVEEVEEQGMFGESD